MTKNFQINFLKKNLLELEHKYAIIIMHIFLNIH